MDLRDDVAWVLSFLPLAGICVLVPTIEHVSTTRRWFQLPISRRTLFEHFVHHPSRFHEGKHLWTLVTHQFCHMNDAHLEGNVLALVGFSRLISSELGYVGVWLTFLLGGAFSSLDTFGLHMQQARNSIAHRPSLLNSLIGPVSQNVPPTAPQAWGFGQWAREAVNSVRTRFIEIEASTTLTHSCFAGASGGIFALIGMEAMLTIEQLAVHVGGFVRDVHRQRKLPATLDELSANPHAHKLLRILPMTCLQLMYVWGLLSNAWKGVNAPDLVNQSGKRSSALVQYEVSHSGHLDGFAFGVGAYVAVRLAGCVHRCVWRMIWSQRDAC